MAYRLSDQRWLLVILPLPIVILVVEFNKPREYLLHVFEECALAIALLLLKLQVLEEVLKLEFWGIRVSLENVNAPSLSGAEAQSKELEFYFLE
jgi:hypothetical protein